MSRLKQIKSQIGKTKPERFSIQVIRLWIINHPIELFFTLLIIVALLFLFNPFPRLEAVVDQMNLQLPRPISAFGRWLAYSGGARLLAGALVAAAIGVISLRVRQNWVAQMAVGDGQCPQCNQTTLRRIHRKKADRLLNYLSLPVRRYKCKNCRWEGRRTNGN